MKEESVYYLMHQDDIVTAVVVEQVSGSIIKMASKVQKDLLPPGAALSSDDLKRWWKRRAVPLSQGNIQRILSARDMHTPQDFLLKNMGLSLSDHYWMKPLDSDYTWDKVNLFSNDFKDEIGDLQFTNNLTAAGRLDLTGKTIFYPSASTQGELKKKWVIQGKDRYLVKGNYHTSSQQSINEVIATLLHKKQGKAPYTEYRLCDLRMQGGQGLGCICKGFATLQTEFIPAYDVACSQKRKNDKSEYEHFIYVCKMNGMKEEKVRSFLEYQILTDFVLTNTDRHFNNFGILRDASTLQWIDMAPIFDSGNSMFWDCPGLPLNSRLLDITVSSFRTKETDLLKYVTDTNTVDLQKLPGIGEVKELLMADMDEKRADGILLGYQKKIDLLKAFQGGDRLWAYGY